MNFLSDKQSLYKLGGWTFAICAVAEILSYAGFYQPIVSWLVLGIIWAAALIASLKDLKYGLLIVMAELVIGSQGYLFSFGGQASGISLRIGLWIIVMAIWLGTETVAALRGENVAKKYFQLRYIKPLVAILAALALGTIIGLLYHNDFSYFFIEAKRWLYLLIIFPFLVSFRSREDLRQLGTVMLAGILFVALKTLVLVYLFSHFTDWWIYDVYGWMRASLLGEITSLPNGFYRVFIQSQVFLIPGIIFLLAAFHASGQEGLFRRKGRHRAWIYVASITVFSALTASLSRSFWLAAAITLAAAAAIAVVCFRPAFKHVASLAAATVGSIGLGIGLVFLIIALPPEPKVRIDTSLLTDRATKIEAGAASRWSLLPVMWAEIEKSPVWGYGFGKTVTYKSSDPRITSSTVNGEYTTYAFEWGWFDIWLKLGLIGLAAYGWLLWRLCVDSWRLWRKNWVMGATAIVSLGAIVIVHFFTPYLNHPLGFGYLAALVCLLSCHFSKDLV